MNRVTNGNLPLPSSTMDKSKDWQLEILMEKLRSKASQYKNFGEISKNVRMAMLEKRYALDSVEKSQHQKCLDTLQHSIKVTSLQSMVERLESLTRQLGLKFTVGPPVFISSDMFYLEILLEPTGAVKDVKVHHEGKEQQSCQELLNCLSRGDFADFTAQLEGFASIYHLNAEKKIKEKAFTALQSLEADLSALAQLQLFMKEPANLLHKSPVGILEKRRGGHPMKLTYFVSPYDLINVERADLDPLTVDIITSKNLGYSVTVCVEGSTAHKLQTTTLLTVNRSMNGKNTPIFPPLNSQNSAVIPACFILKLSKPMPMCVSLVRQIQQATELDSIDLSVASPLLNLIVKHSSDGKLESGNNKGLFVTLPDQTHCYFMTENKNMSGVVVSSIPFTHPTHVSQILVVLRQQALFNTIIGSCVRPNSRQDFENMTMFEVSALSWNHISISLEHPCDENMATVEIDLSDITNLICHVQSPGSPPPMNTPDILSELSTKILNRCFSIPVTMRSIIKQWEKQIMHRSHYNGHENFSLPLGSGDPGGHKGTPGGGISEYGGLETKIKQEPSSTTGHGMMMQTHQGMFLNESMMTGTNFPNFPSSEGVLSNMELTNILAGTSETEKSSKKHSKRRATDEMYKGSKRKAGEDSELLMETSSSDSTSRSTPLSHEATPEIATPNSALGFHSDLELSGLDPTELLGQADKQGTEFDNIDELGDVDMLTGSSKEHRPKSRDQATANLLVDLGEKSLIPPNVSITPIPSPSPGYGQGGNQEKRSGIEIIPIATSASNSTPSSITITPIASPVRSSEERSREKKSSKNRTDEKSKQEKKRKRKRDESPMGPPEKVPPKQDPLTKPVSVTIKPAESPPQSSSCPPSPTMSMIRKYSTSPTPGRTVSMSGKLSPSLMKPGIKGSSSHHSPKHSPAHVPSSPKHIPGLASPKSHATSPKHPSTSGSGKPSMSALKNAASSPSSKSSGESKSKSLSKESSRDKDKKLSSIFNVSNSKIKSSSVKVKPLDLNISSDISSTQDSLPSPSGCSDSSKSSGTNTTRNRKGSLSAIVDKLKSAQCDSVTDMSSKSSSSSRERSGQASSKSSESSKSSGKIGDNKNSEYMVKQSFDGMKITINKTRSKDSSKANLMKSTSGTGSPKVHTGLKPGVNSGPLSRKPQQQLNKSGSSPATAPSVSSTSSTNYPSSSTVKTSSSSSKVSSTSSKNSSSSSSSGPSNLSKSASKLSSSPKTSSTSSDLARSKDRSKLNKSNSDKSIFLSKEGRKSSPTPNKDESDNAYKMSSKMDPFSNPMMMEGLMKQLDKNFQIPKLSARSSNDDKKSSNKISNMSDSLNNINRASTVDTKIFEMTKSDLSLSKYPLALSTNKAYENSLRNNVNSVNPLSLTGSSPKYRNDDPDDKKKDLPQNLSQGKDDLSYKMNYSSKSFSSSAGMTEPLSLSTKCSDMSSKFIAPAPKDDKKDSKTKSDSGMLLDYSNSSKSDLNKCGTLGSLPFPSSPSVSVHIVKSPAPSPIVNPSPHSSSPCITDDELMDEALVGLGK